MSLTRGVLELKLAKAKVGKSTRMADKGANTEMANKGFNEEMASFMMTMMSRMLQEQNVMNWMESELNSHRVQMAIERINKFNGEGRHSIPRGLRIRDGQLRGNQSTNDVAYQPGLET